MHGRNLGSHLQRDWQQYTQFSRLMLSSGDSSTKWSGFAHFLVEQRCKAWTFPPSMTFDECKLRTAANWPTLKTYDLNTLIFKKYKNKKFYPIMGRPFSFVFNLLIQQWLSSSVVSTFTKSIRTPNQTVMFHWSRFANMKNLSTWCSFNLPNLSCIHFDDKDPLCIPSQRGCFPFGSSTTQSMNCS